MGKWGASTMVRAGKWEYDVILDDMNDVGLKMKSF